MTGTTRYKSGIAPEVPEAGYTTLFVDVADHHIKQIDDMGQVLDLTDNGGGGGNGLIFAPSGVNENGGFVVTEEGALNDSIRISAGQISLISEGIKTLITLTSDFVISQGDGLQASGAHKLIALPYIAGDESYVNTSSISLFVATDNELTIAVISTDINILGRGTFDIGGPTVQDYRSGIELTKLFYLAAGANLAVSGRAYSVFDRNDADVSNNRGNGSSDFGCEFYDDAGTVKYRTTKDAIVLRRSAAPIGSEALEQYATEDLFSGMNKDKAKTTTGAAIRGMVRGLVDAQGEVDYAPNTDFLPGGQYEDYWNFMDQTAVSSPSQAAVWTVKAANKWSLMVLTVFAGSGNVIMVLGKEQYDTADIDTAKDALYTIDINDRTADVSQVGYFLVQAGATLTVLDIKDLATPKTLLTQ